MVTPPLRIAREEYGRSYSQTDCVKRSISTSDDETCSDCAVVCSRAVWLFKSALRPEQPLEMESVSDCVNCSCAVVCVGAIVLKMKLGGFTEDEEGTVEGRLLSATVV